MLTHAEIWSAIDRLATENGYSPSGLARKAGLDPTTFNRSKRISADGKPRWPSTESISKILGVTKVTMTDFATLSSGDKKSAKRGYSIPMLGFAQAGRAGYFDEDGVPQASAGWDQINIPTKDGKEDRDIYALEVHGDSMQPLYREGDIVVVSPHAAIRKGDRVVVRLRSGEVMIKELVRKSMEKYELRSLNKAHDDMTLKANEISFVARVQWVSQ